MGIRSCHCASILLDISARPSTSRVRCGCQFCQSAVRNSPFEDFDDFGAIEQVITLHQHVKIKRGKDQLYAHKEANHKKILWSCQLCNTPLAITYKRPSNPLMYVLLSCGQYAPSSIEFGILDGYIWRKNLNAPFLKPANMIAIISKIGLNLLRKKPESQWISQDGWFLKTSNETLKHSAPTRKLV